MQVVIKKRNWAKVVYRILHITKLNKQPFSTKMIPQTSYFNSIFTAPTVVVANNNNNMMDWENTTILDDEMDWELSVNNHCNSVVAMDWEYSIDDPMDIDYDL